MLAIATAALIVLATTAEAAFVKNDYGGRESYKHEDSDYYKPSNEHKKGEDYPEPSHKSHYADQYYGHNSYDVEPSYAHEWSSPSYKQTPEPSYRYKRGADKMDNYDEDGKDEKGDKDGDKKGDGEGGDGEGGNEPGEDKVDTETWVNLADSLSLIAKKLADRDDGGEGGNGEEGGEEDEDDDDEEEGKMKDDDEEMKKSQKYRKSHQPRSYYRSKRSVAEEAGVTESQAMEETMDLVDGLREEQQRRRNKCQCTSHGPKGHHKPCHRRGEGRKYFCYVKHKCHKSKRSKHHGFHWSSHACCGKNWLREHGNGRC